MQLRQTTACSSQTAETTQYAALVRSSKGSGTLMAFDDGLAERVWERVSGDGTGVPFWEWAHVS